LAQAEQGDAANSRLMPAERAKATFEDSRVKKFLEFVSGDFGVTCPVPAYDKTKAVFNTPRTNGDFVSTFYEIRVSCSGTVGTGKAGEIGIRVEFAPPRGDPLNLTLSVYFRE
jgi:hypothetical protein